MAANHPRELQRAVLVQRLSPSCSVQARLVAVVHGTLSPGDDLAASLIVTEFRLTPLRANKRIKSAQIKMTFEVLDAPAESSVDVLRFAPDSEHIIYHPNATIITETKTFGGDFPVGLGAVGASIGYQRQETRTTKDAAKVIGRPLARRNQGLPPGVEWDIYEGSIQQTGIPSYLRTAVLLRRTYKHTPSLFSGLVEIDTDISGFSLRGIQGEDKVDPVFFDPALPPFGDTSEIDVDNLGSLDLTKLMDVAFPSPMVQPEPQRQARQEIEALLDRTAVHDVIPGPREPETRSETFFVELWNLENDGIGLEQNHDTSRAVLNLENTRFTGNASAVITGPLSGLDDLDRYFRWIRQTTPTMAARTAEQPKVPGAIGTEWRGFCKLITRRSDTDGFTSFQKLSELLEQPSINTMIDFFELGESYALQRRHDRGTCQALSPIERGDGIHKRYIIQTPFYKKGFWSLVLYCKMDKTNKSPPTTRMCGILHADKHTDLSQLFHEVNESVANYGGHHPMLLPLRLFLSHFVATSETFKSVLADIADIDRRILEELENRSRPEEASRLHRDLSMTLHKCGMELVDLGRRTRFEEQLADCLEKELRQGSSSQMEAGLLSLITTSANMSKSRELDIEELPGKIESLRNVLYSLITQHDSYLQSRLARESLRDSKAMKTLSILTILFLPGAFIATVFSTDMFEFADATRQMRIYLAITIPLTVVLMLGWALWIRNTTANGDAEKGGIKDGSGTSLSSSGEGFLDNKWKPNFFGGGFFKEKKRD